MRKILFLFLAAAVSVGLLAQESIGEADGNIDETSEAWYASPWIWIAGAAILIVILVALTRKKDGAQ